MGEMVRMEGTYEIEKVVNMKQSHVAAKLIITSHRDAYSFKWIYKDSSRIVLTFELDTPFEDSIARKELTTVVNKDGDKLIFTSTNGRMMVERTYKFDEVGAVMTFEAVGTTEIFQIHYKRIRS